MKILVDLDDTLVNMMEKSLYYYNGWNWRSVQELEFNYLKSWDLPDRHIFEEIWRIPGFFADLPWMDQDAPTILGLLKSMGHKIVVVTAAPTWESCRDKYQWVHTHLRIPGIIESMDDLVITRGKHHVQGECMIDDKPSNLEGREIPILFDRPWNRDVEAKGRARSWNEVYATFARLKPRSGSRAYGGCY